jgi:general secretion pathway protein E/type IV pilus assembly protein PilB
VNSTDELVVRLAVEKRLVDCEALAAVRERLAAAPPSGASPPLVETLIADGALGREAALELLGEALALPWLRAEDLLPEPAALAAVPRELALRAHALPLSVRGVVLRLAVADPLDPALESLGDAAQLAVEPVLAPAEAIRAALLRCYGPVATPGPAAAPAPDPVSADYGADSEAGDAPVARLVQHLVEEALRRRASDIHIEPQAQSLRLRMRIDGVLQEVDGPPKRLHAALISRLKLMARMALDEKRVPQDGRIQVLVARKAIDLRASCLPTVYGESMVLRVLEAERLSLDWSALGLWPDDEQRLARAIDAPDGLVLVTGPTGSGKTTTLYTCLHRLNRPDRKIITVEDPIEYRLAGINQVPVRTDTGLTFSTALRAILRQAPNVVMIGEIRDRETAEIAVNAAQTGHLVFSTLHTNDAAGAVARLIDLGVKPFLLAATLRAVVAQRLVRRVCRDCQHPYQPAPAELRGFVLPAEALSEADWRRGAGCPECHGSGYRGRMGVYELLVADEELRRLIYGNVTAAQLRAAARQAGMRTMREDGLRKTLAGLTTIVEIAAQTVGDSDQDTPQTEPLSYPQ